MTASEISSTRIRAALAGDAKLITNPAANLATQQAAQQAALHTVILVVQETGSTNADLLAQTGQLSGPTLLVAIAQNAGRGRGQRSWLSAPGHSLTFSLAWPFSQALHTLLGLPLAVGVALAEALATLGVQVQLKWPNDILKDGKKLAGILIESNAGQTENWAVIGIGLNLLLPDVLQAQIPQAIADAPWLAQMDRNILLAHLLQHLIHSLQEFSQSGLTPFVARWNQRHAHHGQSVCILDQGQIIHEGRAQGIDAQGRLLLDTASGPLAVLAGDVSLRVSQAAQGAPL